MKVRKIKGGRTIYQGKIYKRRRNNPFGSKDNFFNFVRICIENHFYVISGNARADLKTLQQNSSQYELAINFLDDDSLEELLKRLLN